MNTFLACFLAVIFAMVARDLMWRTLAQMWVARQMKRAGVRRVSSSEADTVPMAGARINMVDVQRQTAAFTNLHIAALDFADAYASNAPNQSVLGLVQAANDLRGALPAKTIEIIRTVHKRETA